ncbi:MAG: peptide-methionine (R)-S-oxide reductase, partial [Flavobacteriaceae bacterium]
MKSTVFVALLLTTVLSLQAQEKESPKTFEVYKSDADWKKQLSGMEYYVLRRGGTEYAFTSELLDEKRKCTYVCAACENPVFRS